MNKYLVSVCLLLAFLLAGCANAAADGPASPHQPNSAKSAGPLTSATTSPNETDAPIEPITPKDAATSQAPLEGTPATQTPAEADPGAGGATETFFDAVTLTYPVGTEVTSPSESQVMLDYPGDAGDYPAWASVTSLYELGMANKDFLADPTLLAAFYETTPIEGAEYQETARDTAQFGGIDTAHLAYDVIGFGDPIHVNKYGFVKDGTLFEVELGNVGTREAGIAFVEQVGNSIKVS